MTHASGFVIWLYALIAIQNGGGALTMVAILLTAVLAIAAIIGAIFDGDWITFGVLCIGLLSAILVPLFVRGELIS